MSIATEIERLQTAKADIKSAIENKGVTVGDGTIDTYAEKIGEISGGDNYYDTFWDSYQNSGNRTNYANAFSGAGWNDTTFNPKYNITIAAASSSAFDSALMTEVNVDIVANFNTLSRTFYSNRSIVTIKKIKLLRDDIEFDRTFLYCVNLENIVFEGAISKNISFANSDKLSDTSIQNIIDCLADLTGGTAQTLTLHATVGGKLTDEQKASITTKNWTLVY